MSAPAEQKPKLIAAARKDVAKELKEATDHLFLRQLRTWEEFLDEPQKE